MSQIRRIKIPALYNLRDLGGYAGAEGKSTCWNKLYRCDCPAELTADQWEVMKGLGIKTLVDIRSTYEANELPVKAPDYMTYIQRPFFYEEPGADLTGEAGKKFLESLSIDYCVMTESSLKSVAAILNAILENITKGSVAFFCTAGKDRTGIIAAEILRLCGVCDDDIIADYSITEIYNAEVIEKKIAAIPKEILDQVSPETMALAASSKPETMRRYLNWSKEFNFLEVIDKNGFSRESQKKLKDILLS